MDSYEQENFTKVAIALGLVGVLRRLNWLFQPSHRGNIYGIIRDQYERNDSKK